MENKKFVKGDLEVADIYECHPHIEAYWCEIMPKSDVVTDPSKLENYFLARFADDINQRKLYWAIVNSERVGFVTLTIADNKQKATIDDFYILPSFRRRGFGTAVMQAIYQHLDTFQIEQIDLNVRRDTPQALKFWEAQGFRIAHYQMRQYRDPNTGTSFIGALSSDFS